MLPAYDDAGGINSTVSHFDAHLSGTGVIASGSIHVSLNASGNALVSPHALAVGNASVNLRLTYGSPDKYEDFHYDFSVVAGDKNAGSSVETFGIERITGEVKKL